MGLPVVRPEEIPLVESRSVVGDGDLEALRRLPGHHADEERGRFRVDSVFDRVLHDGLKGQRRESEPRRGRVELHEQPVLEPHLLHRQIGPGVRQLVRERDCIVPGKGSEVSRR